MNNKLIVFPLFFFLFFMLTPSYAALTLNYNYNTNDALVRQNYPTTNYGYTQLYVGQATNGTSQRSYLMWNISDLTSTGIINATLSLYSITTLTATKAMYISVYNTTLNWTEANITWNNQTVAQTLFSNDTYNITQYGWVNINVTEAIRNAVDNGEPTLSILLKAGSENNSVGFGAHGQEYGDATYRPYITVHYNDSSFEPCGNYAGYPEGTTCLGSTEDSTRRGYVSNYDFCHLTFGSCPVGSICIAYTNTNPALPTTPVWTVNTTGCLNLTNAHVITNRCVDYYGNITNCSAITTTNSSWELGCANTTSTCYDALCFPVQCSSGVSIDTGCTSWAGGVALGLGGFLGVTNCGLSMNISAIILTMLLASILVAALGIYAGIGGKTLGTVFIFASLMFLILFTVAGWFPSWLIIVLIVVSALSMGGILGGLVGG